jgi:hypothetical protein
MLDPLISNLSPHDDPIACSLELRETTAGVPQLGEYALVPRISLSPTPCSPYRPTTLTGQRQDDYPDDQYDEDDRWNGDQAFL